MPIHVLPDQLAAQIAAGEVIERPASVVKELVENALDAGASMINVEVRDGGKRFLRVTDNGSGIPSGEVELAFVHHATSKLSSVDDLFAINTLGFRGEALPSIAAVSQVTLLTQGAGDPVGTELKLNAGRITSREMRVTPAGTIVTVENLFHNTPARLKFLKSTATESSRIHELVNRFALAYPKVRFGLSIDGRLVFQTAGNGEMNDVLIAVYGIDVARQMIALESSTAQSSSLDSVTSDPIIPLNLPQTTATGFISRPSLSRTNRSHMVFFVNGRYIQDRNLSFAVTEAYHTFLTVGRYPVSVVMLSIPPDEVDVNVHPTKAEVRFRDPHKAFNAVQRAVRATLVSMGEPPLLANPSSLSMDFDRQSILRSLGSISSPASAQAWPANMDVSNSNTEHQTMSNSVDAFGAGASRATPFKENSRPSMQDTNTDTSFLRLPMLRVLGQVARTYIIAEGPEGIFLVDQHAAHERVLYEKFSRNQLESVPSVSQVLLDPIAVNLTPRQAARLETQVSAFAAVGFMLEPFGGNAFLIRAVPSILREGDPRTAFVNILDEMAQEDEGQASEHSSPIHVQQEAALIASVCKQSAIKGGRLLSMPEMQELIQQLEQCESPRTCPHGRPTVIRLGLEQLAREFRRT